jgi:hypothetical protein
MCHDVSEYEVYQCIPWYTGIPLKKWLFYDEDPWDFGALLLHKERTCASGVEAQTSSR